MTVQYRPPKPPISLGFTQVRSLTCIIDPAGEFRPAPAPSERPMTLSAVEGR